MNSGIFHCVLWFTVGIGTCISAPKLLFAHVIFLPRGSDEPARSRLGPRPLLLASALVFLGSGVAQAQQIWVMECQDAIKTVGKADGSVSIRVWLTQAYDRPVTLQYGTGDGPTFRTTDAGRKRHNVLGALDYVSKQLTTVVNTTYINALTFCELLQTLTDQHP